MNTLPTIRESQPQFLALGSEHKDLKAVLASSNDSAGQDARADSGLIIPTHEATTAAEHNKFPKGRW